MEFPDGIRLDARPGHQMVYAGRGQLLTDSDGWVRGGLDGYYQDSTRFLSRMELEIEGAPPKPTGVSVVRREALTAYYVAAPIGPKFDRRLIVSATHRVGAALTSCYRLDNYDRTRSHHLALALRLDADFADRMDAENDDAGFQRAATWDGSRNELSFRLQHPELDRAVRLGVVQAPPGLHWDEDALRLEVELPPGGSAELRLVAQPLMGGEPRHLPIAGLAPGVREAARRRERLYREAPTLSASEPMVARAWSVAVADLASLPLELDGAPATPAAGLPLYQEYYARDALTTAWQALPLGPEMMRDTLRYAAATLGDRIDDFFDEEPGKTLARERWGPRALLRQDPFARHYGDYAGPCDFLIMLGQYLAWTDDVATLRPLLPAARQVLDWLERYGDLDGDGFIEYVTRVPDEMRPPVKNQGWKDSPTAVPDARGKQVENPIATCELQGYLYVGLQQSATVFARLGDLAFASDLLGRARRLKRRFNDAFWLEDEGFYAFGLGPDKRPIRTAASNAGHLLATGIVPRRKATRVAERLMRDDLFSGWGIRTLSSDHPSYNPFSYHLGSVWPVEQGTFALGFARYGLTDEVQRLAEGLFAASTLFVDARLPEALGGLPRDDAHPHPGIYPDANDLQGWSSGAVIMMVQALLGLRPVASARLMLVDPHLPPWLRWLRLEGLRVGRGSIDLDAWRTADGRTRVRSRSSGVRLLRVPSPKRIVGRVTP